MNSNNISICKFRMKIVKFLITFTIPLIISFINLFGQSSNIIKKLSARPKVQIDFPIYYNMITPSLDFDKWELDFNNLIKPLNPNDKYSIVSYKYIKDLHVRMAQQQQSMI